MILERYLQNKRRELGFSKNLLTVIAMLTMLIDHIAFMLIKNGKLYGYNESLYNNAISLPEAKKWVILYQIMRMIGRISFPIFCLLIVEGFRKSSNIYKYILRVLILAIVSEIPFDLMVFNEFLTPITRTAQNVVWTYFIALIMLVVLKILNSFSTILGVFSVIIAMLITYYFKTDYAIEGIIIIYVMYMFRNDVNVKCFILLFITFIMSFGNYYGAAILSVPFIFLYDEQKGYIDLKRIHYVFYPLHMLILYAIVFFSNVQNSI